MRTFLYREQQHHWADLVRALPAKEFAKPSRSTVPLLAWWHDHLPVGVTDLGGATLEVEAEVASTMTTDAAGRPHKNTASYTDVMLRTASAAVAVEGKWTEKKYPTVKDWLAESPGPNREGVLNHWLGHLAPYCGSGDHRKLGACTNQMLHRAASACAQGLTEAIVMYQVFGVQDRPRYLDDLRRFRAALDPVRLRLVLMVVPTATTESWRRLDKATPEEVRVALLRGGLFEFGQPEVVDV